MTIFGIQAAEEDERLVLGGGAFRSAVLETAYRMDHLADTRRHARFLFAVAALLNIGFLPVDWRFIGTSHFALAVGARLFVIALSIACLLATRRDAGRRTIDATLVTWMAGVAIGVALLVTSRSLLAQFVVVILPVAYYVAVPVRFAWTVIGGLGCSLLLLAGYMNHGPSLREDLGLVLATLTMNVALGMAVARSSKLARQAWASARAARRLGDALAASRATLERLFVASPIPLVLTSAGETGRVLAVSQTAAALLGDPAPITLRQYYADGDGPDPLLAALADGGGSAEIEVTASFGRHQPHTLLLRATRIELADRPAILTGIVDITERKAAQVTLEQIASTDALTGLRNRLSFFGMARAEMTRMMRRQAPLCLLMVDIDHFKAINDTHGHSAGDAVLRSFAALCAEALGEEAIVGRLGGEEFGILLPDTGLTAAAARAERLRETVAAARTQAGGNHIAITISIGVARVLPLERDLDQPLARADLALYGAKRAGRNRVVTDQTGAWRATG